MRDQNMVDKEMVDKNWPTVFPEPIFPVLSVIFSNSEHFKMNASAKMEPSFVITARISKFQKTPNEFLPSYDGKDSGHIIPL